MKDKEKTSFTLTDLSGKERGYKGDSYCFKHGINHMYVFYSVLEGVWVFYLLDGWIKINGKVLGDEPVYFVAKCTINIDESIYYFKSCKGKEDSASKILSEAISSSDEKLITRQHVFYFIEQVKHLKNAESYYNILLSNPIFVEKDRCLKIDYYQYGKCRYLSLETVLLAETMYKTTSDILFEMIDFKLDFVENTNTTDICCNPDYYIINSVVYHYGEILNFVKYMFLHLKDIYFTDTQFKSSATTFEIFRMWIQTFYKYENPFNGAKTKLESYNDVAIKRRCVSGNNKEEQISSTVVYKELKDLRDCFTDVRTHHTKAKQIKNRRSCSLVEDKDEDRNTFWMFNRHARDI